MTQPYKRAFLASTYDDLKDHREFVIRALRESKIHVDPMEEWQNDPDEPTQFCPERVEGCDLMVLLVGRRRGHVPPGGRESITQLEYRYAIEHNIDVLVFFLDDRSLWHTQYDERESDPEFLPWRKELMLRHVSASFQHVPESIPVAQSISQWVQKPRVANRDQAEAARKAVMAACKEQIDAAVGRLTGRDRYRPESYVNRDIDAYLWRFLEAKGPRFLPLIGPPGSGKTSAICNLAQGMIERGWPGVLLDTSEFHLGGRSRSTLEAVIIDALRSKLGPGAPQVGAERGLADLNTLMRHCMPDREFVAIIDGLDEIRFVSQVGSQGFPVSAEALANLVRGADALDQVKFIVTCRRSPWKDTFEYSGAVRSLDTTLPQRRDEEVELKQIAPQGPHERRGPELCTLDPFNDVELSLAVAKYEQNHGVRVHLAGNAWEDARDPFMLGAAFLSWSAEKRQQGHTGRFYYCEDPSRTDSDRSEPPWTVDRLDYFDKLDEYWRERLNTIVDAIVDFNADRSWTRPRIRRQIDAVLQGLVGLIMEQGKVAVPSRTLLDRLGGSTDLLELVLQRMCEAELISFQEDPERPAEESLQFSTTRHTEYQVGQRMLERLAEGSERDLIELLERVCTCEEVLRQPFQLALRELFRMPQRVTAEHREAILARLLENAATHLPSLSYAADDLPFLPEAQQKDHADCLMWCVAAHVWDVEHSLAAVDFPDQLNQRREPLEQARRAVEALLSRDDLEQLGDASAAPSGEHEEDDPFGEDIAELTRALERLWRQADREEPSEQEEAEPDERVSARQAIDSLRDALAEAEATVLQLLEALEFPALRELGEKTASGGAVFREEDIRALAGVHDQLESRSARQLADRLGTACRSARLWLKRLDAAKRIPSGSDEESTECDRALSAALSNAATACESMADLQRPLRSCLAGPAQPRECDVPARLRGTVPGAKVHDLDDVASFACRLLVRTEPALRQFAERALELIHCGDRREFGGISVEHLVHNHGSDRYKQDDFSGAIRLYALTLRFDPDLLETWFNLALAQTRLSQYPEALQSMDRVIELNDSLAEVYYTRGLIFEYMEQYDNAIGCYRRALELDESYAKAQTQLKIAVQKRDGESAALPSVPDPSSAEGLISEAYRVRDAQDYLRAEALFRQAFERLKEAKKPIDADVLRAWAYCLLNTALAEIALEAYLTARDTALAERLDRGDVAGVFNNLGCLYWDQEDVERAEFYYLAALAADAMSWSAEANLTGLFAGKATPERMIALDAAEREAQRLAVLQPDNPASLNTLAEVARRKSSNGQLAARIGQLRQAAQFTHYRAVASCFELTRHFKQEGDLQEACRFARRAVAELYPQAEQSVLDQYMPSGVCEWYLMIAVCAALVDDSGVLHDCRRKVRDIVNASGPGPHVPPHIRLYSPLTETLVPIPVFLEQLDDPALPKLAH